MFVSLGLFCIFGLSVGAPLQDTPEVLEAKEKFLAAFETAIEGKHAALVPVNNDVQAPQIANAYLDDTEPVAEEKAKFKIAFDTAEAGGLRHMQSEPVANFYIAKVDEVAEAEAMFMKEFETAEAGEHVKYAPVNNDIQAPQVENEYLPYTQEVVDASNQFMTYFAEAKLKAMNAVDAAPAAPAAVKAVAAVDQGQAVLPTFYNLPAVQGFPAFTYPLAPLNYYLLPVVAQAAPGAASVVEEA